MRRVTFQVLEGIDKGKVFRDLSIPVTIGREEGNALRLNDERVSRFHAKVQSEDGDVIITDLESTNGTRVNGAPVQIRRLRPGDQLGLGRSTLLFGTLEEIAARRHDEHHASKNSGVPQGPTIPGPGSRDDLGFDLNLGTVYGRPPETNPWGASEQEMPPLPQKLTPAQAARLAEIFDYLHRGITASVENIEANDDGTLVKIGYNEWQTIQAVQMFLARYARAVADPDHQVD